MSSKIKFLTFDEAVAAALAEPGVEFLGLHFPPPFRNCGTYMLSADAEDDSRKEIDINYEGSDLFDSCGNEEYYSLTDAPLVAKSIFYARLSDIGDICVCGSTAEHILHLVLPGLDDSDDFENNNDFVKAAAERFLAFWRQT